MENCRLNLLSDVSGSYLHIKTVHFCMNAKFLVDTVHMRIFSVCSYIALDNGKRI